VTGIGIFYNDQNFIKLGKATSASVNFELEKDQLISGMWGAANETHITQLGLIL
jgi:hypothetical protein